MNRKSRSKKSAQQIKDERIGLTLEEIKQDIEISKKQYLKKTGGCTI